MIYINLLDYQAKRLFQTISTTLDYIGVELYLAEYMMSWKGNLEPKSIPYACIDNNQHRRAFIVGQDKIASFAFNIPFKVKISNGISYICFSFWNIVLTSMHISEARTILNSMKSRKDYLYVANDIESDDEKSLDEISYRLFEHLWKTEPSYFRLDHDLSVPNSEVHPTNHIDVNFSNFSTFKVGLDNRIELDELRDILDKNTRCRILR